MTEEQEARLREKAWSNRARHVRPAIAASVGAAIGQPASEIVFTDFAQTNALSDTFAEEARKAKSIELPDRASAIRLVQKELCECRGQGFLMVHNYHVCGAVQLDVAEAILNIDPLMQSQHEYYGLMGAEGDLGVIVSSQEGSLPIFPRHVTIWKKETGAWGTS